MKNLLPWQKPCIIVDPVPATAVMPMSEASPYIALDSDPTKCITEGLLHCNFLSVFSFNDLSRQSLVKIVDPESKADWWLYGAYVDEKSGHSLVQDLFVDSRLPENGLLLFGNKPPNIHKPLDFLRVFLTRMLEEQEFRAIENKAIEYLKTILEQDKKVREADTLETRKELNWELARLVQQFLDDHRPKKGCKIPDAVRTIRDNLSRVAPIKDTLRAWAFDRPDWDDDLSPWPTEPTSTADLYDLVEHFPHGHLITDTDFQNVEEVVEDYLATSPHALSRDNTYTVLPVITTENEKQIDGVVVIWEPHGDKTPYLHLRRSIESLVPAALSKSRSNSQSPPNLPELETFAVESGWEPPDPEALVDDFHIRPPESIFRERDKVNDRIKAQIEKEGIEALGWYQAWHRYSEDSWGIYLHTNNLDEFSMMIQAEAKARAWDSVRVPIELAALLSYTKVYYHELFHARFEACATAIELSSSKDIYLKYFKDVYCKQFLTANCYEELLANFYAYKKICEYAKTLTLKFDSRAIRWVLESLKEAMNMSPPGYKDWKRGENLAVQRQLIAGLRDGVKIGDNQEAPPLEHLLNDAMPVDFRAEDVPTYLYGDGWTSQVFNSMPSCLNTVSRKELRCALRHFDYEEVPGRGKGSHEIWKTDKNVFTLPRTDPIGRKVFKDFLEQNKLSKHDYLGLRQKF